MDWMEQEQERGITITSAATTCEWDGPPHQHHRHARARRLHRWRWSARCASWTAPSRSSTRSRASSRSPRPSGARPTSTACPRICFVNKMDRMGADFCRTVDMIENNLGATPSVLHAADRARRTRSRASSTWSPCSRTSRGTARSPGGDVRHGRHPGRVSRSRRRSTARSCSRPRSSSDDAAMEAYLEGEELGRRRRCEALIRKGTIAGSLRPRSCAVRPSRTRASSPCSTPSVAYLPSPLDVPARRRAQPGHEDVDPRRASPSTPSPSPALAFKIMADPYLRLAHLRARLLRPPRGRHPRAERRSRSARSGSARSTRMHANTREDIKTRWAPATSSPSAA